MVPECSNVFVCKTPITHTQVSYESEAWAGTTRQPWGALRWQYFWQVFASVSILIQLFTALANLHDGLYKFAICTAEFFHPALGIEIALRSDDAWWVWSGDSPYDIHRNTQRNLEYIN